MKSIGWEKLSAYLTAIITFGLMVAVLGQALEYADEGRKAATILCLLAIPLVYWASLFGLPWLFYGIGHISQKLRRGF